jgi:hypothetical protein
VFQALQAALGTLRACYVSWLHQDWSRTPILVQPTDSIPSVLNISHNMYSSKRKVPAILVGVDETSISFTYFRKILTYKFS